MTRVPLPENSGRNDLVLTEKGREFFPTYLSLKRWGDQRLAGPSGPQFVFRDRMAGRAINHRKLLNANGKPLRLGDVEVVAGSGIVPFNQRRFGGGSSIGEAVEAPGGGDFGRAPMTTKTP